MATSAASAQQWLTEQKPDRAAIEEVIGKLEKRIEQYQEEDPALAGSVDALVLLQDHLEQLDAPAAETDAPPANLDTSALIPDADPVQLEDDVKRRAFEALKNQFKDL
ncbi:hypothetical protein [Saccharospirillum mangrovi]|uniref:hypothetical protein n=1 Tax=Saccharospirillum mangrovi TaxID=2161747 RepID=UPI00130066D4|nr:hypothetical protein [Saccharospirillum mangrovi]